MSGLYVLHDVDAVGGGAPWRDLSTPVLPIEAPDLPGHAGLPQSIGGNYDLTFAAFEVARALVDDGRDNLGTVVGVGASGWSAHILALAGRASSLVLVDGLGEPFLDPLEGALRRRNRFRALLDDPAAMAHHDPAANANDPRLAHGIDTHGNRELALEAAGATTVPTLLCSTTNTAPDAEVVAAFADAQVVSLASPAAATVVPAIAEWLGHRRTEALPPQRW